MPRPNNLSNDDIIRYDQIIDNDPMLPSSLASNPVIREICYAGQYLSEQLNKLNCQEHIIGQIMYCAGQMSFGNNDPWKVHQDILDQFVDGSLEFEEDEQLN